MIQELRREHNLTMLLEIAQLPKATFYYHLKKQDQVDKYAQVIEYLEMNREAIESA